MDKQDAHPLDLPEAPVILLAGVDIALRAFLRAILIERGYQVMEARDAEHARVLLGTVSVDLLILDVGPGILLCSPSEDRWLGSDAD